MKKSKSIQIIKQQGIAEFIKYKKIKIVRGILKRTCNYP